MFRKRADIVVVATGAREGSMCLVNNIYLSLD